MRVHYLIGLVSGFYLPGLAPVSYCPVGEESEECVSKIDLFVNRLTSQDSVIPFEYSAFDFCEPEGDRKSPTENLGQVLFGEVSVSRSKKTFGIYSLSLNWLGSVRKKKQKLIWKF